jgi:predicted nuclease of predicted toxin-antitoxin system
LKLKLDENLGKSVATILENAGHDVETITGEGLRGAKGKEVIAVCKTEGRCLVTLDLGFGNPLVFDPGQYSGIAVLRLPQRPSYRRSPQNLPYTHRRVTARRYYRQTMDRGDTQSPPV